MALQKEIAGLKLKVATLELEKLEPLSPLKR